MSYIIAQDGSNNYLMNCGSDIFSKSQGINIGCRDGEMAAAGDLKSPGQ